MGLCSRHGGVGSGSLDREPFGCDWFRPADVAPLAAVWAGTRREAGTAGAKSENWGSVEVQNVGRMDTVIRMVMVSVGIVYLRSKGPEYRSYTTSTLTIPDESGQLAIRPTGFVSPPIPRDYVAEKLAEVTVRTSERMAGETWRGYYPFVSASVLRGDGRRYESSSMSWPDSEYSTGLHGRPPDTE